MEILVTDGDANCVPHSTKWSDAGKASVHVVEVAPAKV